MIDDLSCNKERELILFKSNVDEIIYEIKYHQNYDTALALIQKHNLSFEELIKFTKKLSIEDLAFLADKTISQNKDA